MKKKDKYETYLLTEIKNWEQARELVAQTLFITSPVMTGAIMALEIALEEYRKLRQK